MALPERAELAASLGITQTQVGQPVTNFLSTNFHVGVGVQDGQRARTPDQTNKVLTTIFCFEFIIKVR